MKNKIVVFSPHPDDETLGCGGTVAKKLSEGYEAVVVHMTDGRHAFSKLFNIDSEPTPDELKEIRKEEARKAARVLGLHEENLYFLDFEDGRLKQKQAEAQQQVIEILRKNLPVEAYLPSEKDINPDHPATSKIAKSSINKLGLSTLKYEYSIIQRYSRIGPRMDTFLDFFKHNLIHVDISKFLPLKEAAIKEYKSQITIVSSRQERPVLENIKRFLRSKETFFIGPRQKTERAF
jgi:LmbE family N-acetylglucosaminyl deacetylase